ncbi:hypothetical protein SSPO_003430 [Streptomyces antimycoticus]|uniref:Uncharacterized protein n=1 Tax=Streptomyces antimycoticus TaxID=68175 RepID=A0A499UAE3_9ACTN|nr:hypothetical protein SSPO_003430 [Streptomyces antimycoticus]
MTPHEASTISLRYGLTGGASTDGLVQVAVGPAGVHSDGEATFRALGEVASPEAVDTRSPAIPTESAPGDRTSRSQESIDRGIGGSASSSGPHSRLRRDVPHLLAPIGLQVMKAAGVTLARSLLERVIEQRTGRDPAQPRGCGPASGRW